MRSPHRVVILGGGFAGIRAARRLARDAKRRHLAVTLVSRDGMHGYTPGFYLLAGAVTDAARRRVLDRAFALPIRRLIAGLPVSFVQAEVSAIDCAARTVALADGRSLGYDTLVIALGSEPAYYGIPGLKEHAVTLKSLADADRINRALARLMRGRATPLRVTIGGGGPTGVELAAMLAERIGTWQAGVHVTLVEASPAILGNYPEHVRTYAARELARRGVNVRTGIAITGARADAVALGDNGELPHDMLVWTGGMQPPTLLGTLPYVQERGRLAADASLTCVPQEGGVEPNVYVIGDASCFHYKGNPVPWTAHMAIDQADCAAENILRHIAGKKEKGFRPGWPVFVVPLGTKGGVAQYLGMRIRGRLAQLLSILAEARYLLAMLSPITTWRILRKRFASL